MIRNQWYVVLKSDEVKAHPVGVTRLGEKNGFIFAGSGWQGLRRCGSLPAPRGSAERWKN